VRSSAAILSGRRWLSTTNTSERTKLEFCATVFPQQIGGTKSALSLQALRWYWECHWKRCFVRSLITSFGCWMKFAIRVRCCEHGATVANDSNGRRCVAPSRFSSVEVTSTKSIRSRYFAKIRTAYKGEISDFQRVSLRPFDVIGCVPYSPIAKLAASQLRDRFAIQELRHRQGRAAFPRCSIAPGG